MRCYVALAFLVLAPLLRGEPVRLIDDARPDREFRVTSDSTISGELQTPVAKNKSPELINLSGKSLIDYVERILTVDPKDADHKSLRIYEHVNFRKTTADRTDESTLRPAVRRQVIMKKGHRKVPFSPDGPLQWSEIDLIRTDLVIAALSGLLPDKEVEPGETWKAKTAAAVELTDLEKIDKGELECKFERIETNGPRKVAHISFAGTLQGVNEDGPTRQVLKGKLIVDLTAECITYLSINGEHFLLDGEGKEAGKVAGTFVLTRTPLSGHKGLADSALKGLQLDPTEENTRLLFDSNEMGIRFIYPRNWRVVRTTGRQVTLDETQGSGLLITLDSAAATPSPVKFMGEAIKELQDRGAKVLRRNGPEKVADGIDRFTLDVELGKEPVTMHYIVVRQEKGGTTLAARIPGAFREIRMKELEGLARSFAITRRLDGK